MGAEALLGIVTDILEFSKFSDEGAASRLKFEFVPFSMDKLSSDLARIVGVKAERAGVEVVVRTATPARCSSLRVVRFSNPLNPPRGFCINP